MEKAMLALQTINVLLLGIIVRKMFDIQDALTTVKEYTAQLKQWADMHQRQDDERWRLLTKDMSLSTKGVDQGVL